MTDRTSFTVKLKFVLEKDGDDPDVVRTTVTATGPDGTPVVFEEELACSDWEGFIEELRATGVVQSAVDEILLQGM